MLKIIGQMERDTAVKGIHTAKIHIFPSFHSVNKVNKGEKCDEWGQNYF